MYFSSSYLTIFVTLSPIFIIYYTSSNAPSPNAGYSYAFTAHYALALPNAFTAPNASAPHNAFSPNVIITLSVKVRMCRIILHTQKLVI